MTMNGSQSTKANGRNLTVNGGNSESTAFSMGNSNVANDNNNNNDGEDDGDNPRIRRRRNWFAGGGGGGGNHRTRIRKTGSSEDELGSSNTGKNKRLLSMADFQDGKRHSGGLETTSILQDTAEAFHNISTRFGFSHNKDLNKENGGGNKNHEARIRAMNHVRLKVGLYQNYPLANAILRGSDAREKALRRGGHKQMNHVRGTDGWWRSMLVVEDRAMDNYLGPWLVILLNAVGACLLTDVGGIDLPQDLLEHWDTVYSMVLKTSLAFLLVFRLNRCALRYWEARSLWGNLTHVTRNLVSAIVLYGGHSPQHRDSAIQWGSAFCVATKNFIRCDDRVHEAADEFAGFLTPSQVARLRDSNHPPLFAAAMCRHHLSKIFAVEAATPPGIAHAYTVRLQACEAHVERLVEQVSGMEKIRSTPLPIAYVAHLRTFLFCYCLFLPYVWVGEWSWITVPLTAFTAFALLGIEGASSEVEIPFSKSRPNHLALDAYCLVILDSVLGLIVQDANMDMQGRKGRRLSSVRQLWDGRRSGSDEDSDEYEDDEDEDKEEVFHQRDASGGGGARGNPTSV